MAVIKIENFGGEMPSVSPRALPPNAAQANVNLFSATTEFRPLAQDSTVAAAPAGTKTIYRFARTASGEFNTDPSRNWVTSTSDVSYVKGQVNDERTERTYLTFDDGSARPRVIDATGQDRLLGVPKPASLNVSVNVVDEFTPEEANNFIYGEAAEAIKAAIAAAIPNSGGRYDRYDGNTTTTLSGPYDPLPAGVYPNWHSALHNRWPNEWWLLGVVVPNARFSALSIPRQDVDAVDLPDGSVAVLMTAVPYARKPSKSALVTALLAIEFPSTAGERSGQAVFTQDQANELAEKVVRALTPDTYAKSLREQLTTVVRDIARILLTDPPPVNATRPQEPARPTVPEFIWVSGDTPGYVRAPEWVAYDEAMRQYREQLAEYERQVASGATTSTAIAARLRELRAKAESLTKQIEAACDKAVDMVKSGQFATELIDSAGGVAGLAGETVTRVIDTRFYIATFVTDWGEESAPCKPSNMVEVDQNDSVVIQRPVTASGESYASRHIVKWRLYRSNVGNQSADFQFVDEIPITTASYTDTKKAEELGEPCVTLTWEEPPYRADYQFDGFPKPVVGTNPYLRGLVGMPNGIMAGFFDNTVAFCEPYAPYAWPVEYQIALEFPIVGLGVFGQTLFVGTTGNPYFISGADSASMSAQKLDAKQACASRKSIASVQGGVLYASPDGLCVADPSGVKVVTQGLFTREDWQKLQPETMVAASHENIYYLFYKGNGGGCLTFDLQTGKLGRIDLQADATFTDTLTDTLYYAHNGAIYAAFAANTKRVGRWRSGKITLPMQTAFAWAKVYGDQSASNPVTLRWYGDGVLRYTVTVRSLDPVRLPPGRYLEHEIEIESSSRVTKVVLAGDTNELKSA